MLPKARSAPFAIFHKAYMVWPPGIVLGPAATHAASSTQNKWGSPMNDKQQNLQDTFLNAVRKSKTSVTIYLVNGVKLAGQHHLVR